MRKNEAGLTILERGDMVRVGNGRVHWVVTQDQTDQYVYLLSPNTKRLACKEQGNVTLVQNVRDTEEWKVENEDEAPVVETSAYAKAVLFALNKLDRHVYAGTVRSNVKAKRRGLNARQKASRKANR